MSYQSIAQAASNLDLLARVTACVAQEQEPTSTPPHMAANQIIWMCCAEPGWGEAWESAQVADPPNPDPGNDPGVITDGMILSAVQKWLPDGTAV